MADLITACMSSEPEDRPTAEQAIAALLPVVTAPPGSPPARGPATPAQRNNGVAGQASEGQQEQQQPQPQQMPPTSPVAAPAGGAALADSAMDVAAGQRQQHEGAAEGA